MLRSIAADLGASTGRVIMAEFDGNRLNLQEIRRFKNQPVNLFDGIYWNIYNLFNEIKLGIKDAAKSHGEIRSIGIDSWGVDFGLIDKHGFLINVPGHYRDTRNIPFMHEVVQKIGESALFMRSGIQLLPINSLFQLYRLYKESPHLESIAETLLLTPDLLNYYFTGEKSAEYTIASTTQFLDLFLKDWNLPLLTELGLSHHLLPHVSLPGTILGRLKDSDLQQLAELTTTEIINTASHDTEAAVISIPSSTTNFAFISSGTWSLMGTNVPEPIINERVRQYNLTNEGGIGSYHLMKNMMGMWLIQEMQRTLHSQGIPSHIEHLITQAMSAKSFSFVFDPDDLRLLHPADIPELIRTICLETGQRPPDDVGTLVRGIFESLALNYRFVLDQLKEVTVRQFEAIHIVGGGSQNSLLSQFTANATQCHVLSGPIEASAIGNILVQLLATGYISYGVQMTDIVRKSFQTISFEPTEKEAWESAYSQFRKIAKPSKV